MSAYRVASAQRRKLSKSLRPVSGLVEKGNNPPTSPNNHTDLDVRAGRDVETSVKKGRKKKKRSW